MREDRAWQDVTTRAFVRSQSWAVARVVAKKSGVVAGADAASEAFRLRDTRCRVRILRRDGQPVRPREAVLEVRGPLGSILSAERTALNVLTYLSGIATQAREFVRRAALRSRGEPRPRGRAASSSRGAIVLDTRKTLPGLRRLQRWAVRCGGVRNHRADLASGVLIKENHLLAVRGEKALREFFRAAWAFRKRRIPIEMECRNRREIVLGLAAGADILMLDNIPAGALRPTVRWIRRFCREKGLRAPLLEVSGGVTLDSMAQIAGAGVDRISVGRLTHSVEALDMSLDVLKIW